MPQRKKFCQYVFFLIFFILGIGQLPSIIGRMFLIMALLVVPVNKVQWFVDEMLNACSKRYMWFLILLVYMYHLPMEDFRQAGESMGRFLNGILQWLRYIAE